MTGERLKELNYPYTTIVHSSMKRAIETATAIHKHLPFLTMSQCDLLREGAPWPPEPPSANWRPEYRVWLSKLRSCRAFVCMCVCMCHEVSQTRCGLGRIAFVLGSFERSIPLVWVGLKVIGVTWPWPIYLALKGKSRFFHFVLSICEKAVRVKITSMDSWNRKVGMAFQATPK